MMSTPPSVRAYVLLWDALRLRNQGLDGECGFRVHVNAQIAAM